MFIEGGLETGTTSAIDGIAATDGTNATTNDVFTVGNTDLDLVDAVLGCTPTQIQAPNSNHGVTCTVNFDIDDYTNSSQSTETFDLKASKVLVMGNVDAPNNTITTSYFEINNNDFPNLNVADGATIATVQVSWRVSIP